MWCGTPLASMKKKRQSRRGGLELEARGRAGERGRWSDGLLVIVLLDSRRYKQAKNIFFNYFVFQNCF